MTNETEFTNPNMPTSREVMAPRCDGIASAEKPAQNPNRWNTTIYMLSCTLSLFVGLFVGVIVMARYSQAAMDAIAKMDTDRARPVAPAVLDDPRITERLHALWLQSATDYKASREVVEQMQDVVRESHAQDMGAVQTIATKSGDVALALVRTLEPNAQRYVDGVNERNKLANENARLQEQLFATQRASIVAAEDAKHWKEEYDMLANASDKLTADHDKLQETYARLRDTYNDLWDNRGVLKQAATTEVPAEKK